ncbi:hypothetical protein AOL_s00210g123 [Orbilia oligospora ATCC 24927]|uniref:F-box domain-containing protein n=1 Tax=Arthrobotrys oligospora (strain ATCC 24927 / CBS 115.81 / DSM 1491) TaxID=756982 RepID=G1XRW5_ARTOA|nr:hypothetical protein AOL_s00210g123 [Orbilia oligospora ATCC 24927]EGX44142.1 hypothetical protein AOL_s00210g123 [Orbilia oligospora ATCC 24927]
MGSSYTNPLLGSLEYKLDELNPNLSLSSGEASNWSAFATALPVDIWDVIFSFMSADSMKNLSGCSKYYRNLVAPALFSHVILDTVSRELFKTGSLASIRPFVRHATVVVPEAPKYLNTVISRFRRIANRERRISEEIVELLLSFPGLRGVNIQFTSDHKDNSSTIFIYLAMSEIVQGLSNSPIHRRNIRTLRISQFDLFPQSQEALEYPYECSRSVVQETYSGCKFWLPDEFHEELDLRDESYNLPNLKELAFKSTNFVNFFEYSEDSHENIHLKLLRSSAPTLRKLTMMVKDIYTGDCQDDLWVGYLDTLAVRYPMLTNLSILIKRWIVSRTFDVITKVFPNVQYLTLDSAGYSRDGNQEHFPKYHQLKRLQRLKRLRLLHWPSSQTDLFKGIPMEEKRGMMEIIKDWVNGGLEDLEYVQFVRRPSGYGPIELLTTDARNPFRSYQDRYVFLVKKDKENGEVELECRIQFPDWYRQGCKNKIYIDLEDVVFEDKSICQYKVELEEDDA